MDFSFAWEGADKALGPWNHLRVVDFRGTEEMSSLYRYEMTLFARSPSPEVDPRDLVGARASLRIATLTEPAYKIVHGVVTEAEELFELPGGMVYRVVLAPPLVRSAHRTRCRIFLEKTIRQIITSVLTVDSGLTLASGATVEPDDGNEAVFTSAAEVFTWRVLDSARIDDVQTRPYCVQYNETDLGFISRLLEEEGISYHFENGATKCLLVLSDADGGRARLSPFLLLGEGVASRSIESMRLGARLRPKKVTLVDYNWKNPALDMAVDAPGKDDRAPLFEYEYPGRYPDAPNQGAPIARARLERFVTEADYAVGHGTCRVLSAGAIFPLEHVKPRYPGEYLVTRLEVRGEQAGVLPPHAPRSVGLENNVPFTATFECARRGRGEEIAESLFRPPRGTQLPRIQGSQTAFVTAGPGAAGEEIHIGGPPGAEIGCVRLRFHWDRDEERLAREPSSCWVRVSQIFAGGGEGGVFHPRVGTECIVDFEDGDPDRPIVTGRVYNGANRPPTTSPSTSTMKSATTPGGGSANEITLEDAAGRQQILLHTPRDWNSEVGRDRSETIASNSASLVGANRLDKTGQNRTSMVGSNESQTIGINAVLSVGGNRNVTVGGDQIRSTGGYEELAVSGYYDVGVGEKYTISVGGYHMVQVAGFVGYLFSAERYAWIGSVDATKVDGAQRLEVAGSQEHLVHGSQTTTLNADQTVTVSGMQTVTVGSTHSLHASIVSIDASGDAQVVAGGTLNARATTVSVFAAAAASVASANTTIEGVQSCVVVSPGMLNLLGAGSVNVSGGPAVISCGGGTISMSGGIVKIN